MTPRESSIYFIYLNIFKHCYFLLFSTLMDILLKGNCFLITSFIYCAKIHFPNARKSEKDSATEVITYKIVLKHTQMNEHPHIAENDLLFCPKSCHVAEDLSPHIYKKYSSMGPKLPKCPDLNCTHTEKRSNTTYIPRLPDFGF